MRNLDQLLSELEARGITIWAEDGALRFRAPKGALTDELKAELKTHKASLLETLGGAPTIEANPDAEHYPLSHQQRRIWVLSQLPGGSLAYNVPLHQLLKGQVNVESLRGALQALVDRHEALRTTFRTVDGEPRQFVRAGQGVDFDYRDLSGEADPEARAKEMADEESRRPFDLENGPLFRAALLRISERRHALLLTAHHIVCDGVSIGIIGREISLLYRAIETGEPAALPPLKVQYRDYAIWQARQLSEAGMAAHRDYWHGKLGGALPVLDLPADFPRPPVQQFNGEELGFQLKLDLLESIRRRCQEEGVSLFMALTALVKCFLFRCCGQQDIIVGSPFAGRDQAELEPQIGFYLNMLALRDELNGEASFRENLRTVKRTILEAFEHQAYPFDSLVNELQVERDVSRSPIFDVLVILQNQEEKPIDAEGFAAETWFDHPGTSKVDITFYFKEMTDGLYLSLEYNSDLFRRERMERMGDQFAELAGAMTADPERPLWAYPFGSETELMDLQRTLAGAEPRTEPTVLAMFDKTVERVPNRIAVAATDRQLSYRELSDESRRLGAAFARRGIGPGALIGVCLERTADLPAALLGIWRSGNAYVPIDPDTAPERMAGMATDSGLSLMVVDEGCRQRVAEAVPSAPLFVAAGSGDETGSDDPQFPALEAVSTTLAYVIYTSGSTGRPKGVGIEHGSLANFILAMTNQPGLREEDSLLAITTVSFDISLLELFAPLTVGATVELASRSEAADGLLLKERLEARRPTIMQGTPATWSMLFAAGWQGDKKLRALCGGEALSEDLAARLLERCGELWNLYGPTETTVWSAARRVSPHAPRQLPESIGRPIPGNRLYLLDARGQALPPGIPGHLCVGGASLARGYWARPGLTAEKFLPDPFSDVPGARMYVTGDLARLGFDGELDFLGRTDFQVKVRGFRIELGEIESALEAHDGIDRAVVVRQEDAAGFGVLASYYITRSEAEGNESQLVEELKQLCRRRLPGYMIPSAFVCMDAFPLTSSGKVNRKALPPVQPTTEHDDADFLAPSGEMEKELARLWRDLLPVDRVGVNDDFFRLGGHSLTATRLVARLQEELRIRMNLVDVFQHPRLGQMAEFCRGLRGLDGSANGSDQAIAPPTPEELEMLYE